MVPMMAPEMVRARVERLRRDGNQVARRGVGAGPGRRAGLREALGVRLVLLGCRLLGEPERIDRVEVR